MARPGRRVELRLLWPATEIWPSWVTPEGGKVLKSSNLSWKCDYPLEHLCTSSYYLWHISRPLLFPHAPKGKWPMLFELVRALEPARAFSQAQPANGEDMAWPMRRLSGLAWPAEKKAWVPALTRRPLKSLTLMDRTNPIDQKRPGRLRYLHPGLDQDHGLTS
jgi:hypothetical protein